MSKTPFRMPQRAEAPAAKLDHWVAGGEGASVAPDGAPPRPERPGKVARLTIDLPPELHAKFKSACALRGTKMIEEVRRFIEDWTQKGG